MDVRFNYYLTFVDRQIPVRLRLENWMPTGINGTTNVMGMMPREGDLFSDESYDHSHRYEKISRYGISINRFWYSRHNRNWK